MKTKMTNQEMGRNVELLSGLNETGKLGYAIARNLRHQRSCAQEYLDLRGRLFQKYGEQAGASVIVPKDKTSAFLEELGDIPDIVHEVEIYTIPEEVFFSGRLTSGQMDQLFWMVEG